MVILGQDAVGLDSRVIHSQFKYNSLKATSSMMLKFSVIFWQNADQMLFSPMLTRAIWSQSLLMQTLPSSLTFIKWIITTILFPSNPSAMRCG